MSPHKWLRPPRWTTRETGIVLALGIVCVALTELVVAETVTPSDPSEAAPPSSTSRAIQGGRNQAALTFALPPIEAFAQVIDRPLFSPTRRPPEHAEDALGQVDELVLTGIVFSMSERTALIRRGQPLKTVRVKEGQSVEGWTVRSISADRVLIENAGTRHELRLGSKSPRGDVSRPPG